MLPTASSTIHSSPVVATNGCRSATGWPASPACETVHGIDEQPGPGEPDYFPFERVQAGVQRHGEDAALATMMSRTGQLIADFERTPGQ